MKQISYSQLKKLLKESINDNWNWCVAEVNKYSGKYKMVTYDGQEPFFGDVSAEQVPRGYYVGYCRSTEKKYAEFMLKLLKERPTYRGKELVVVSKDEFEGNTFTDRDYWEAEAGAGRIFKR